MEKVLEIPEDINIEINENKVTVKKNGDKLSEEFKLRQINLDKKDNKIKIHLENPRKKQKALIGTIKGKIENMIKGLKEGYTYKLRVIYRHFPMNISKEGNKLKIQNFAGEKHPRYADILNGVNVEIKGEEIIVEGKNKEATGQTAANFEQATWIKKKDPRVFEDGIYIVEKPGD